MYHIGSDTHPSCTRRADASYSLLLHTHTQDVIHRQCCCQDLLKQEPCCRKEAARCSVFSYAQSLFDCYLIQLTKSQGRYSTDSHLSTIIIYRVLFT